MLLMTNVDNVNCEHVPYLIDELMKKGASNVHVLPAITKKGRNEYIFLVDTVRAHAEELAEFLAQETGTLGVRFLEGEHHAFEHEIRQLDVSFGNSHRGVLWYGPIDFKIVHNIKGTIISVRAEYEQIREVAEELRQKKMNISFYEIKEMIEQRALMQFKNFSEPLEKKETRQLDPLYFSVNGYE